MILRVRPRLFQGCPEWRLIAADTTTLMAAPIVIGASDSETQRPQQCGWSAGWGVPYPGSMSKTVPAREFRSRLSQFLDEVAEHRAHVTITRRGRPEAVLIPVDEYDALEETAEILADPETVTAVRRGLEQLRANETVPLARVHEDVRRRRKR
jgi:antitoxin YefM